MHLIATISIKKKVTIIHSKIENDHFQFIDEEAEVQRYLPKVPPSLTIRAVTF